MRALSQGLYSKYLQPYYELFTLERIIVILFDEVGRSPLTAVTQICRFTGLDPTFYDEFKFKVHNPTSDLKNPKFFKFYNGILTTIRYRIHNRQALRHLLKRIRSKIEPYYFKFDERKEKEDFYISTELLDIIKAYYNRDKKDLEDLIKRKVSW
jgi:hypothetical protein